MLSHVFATIRLLLRKESLVQVFDFSSFNVWMGFRWEVWEPLLVIKSMQGLVIYFGSVYIVNEQLCCFVNFISIPPLWKLKCQIASW